MSIESDARKVYRHLVGSILVEGAQPKTTYGEIERDTGVNIGPEGGYMGQVLGYISRSCHSSGLPPLTSIVLPKGDTLPSSGYFVELAGLLRDGNVAGWPIDQDVSRWIARPRPAGFDKEINRYQHQPMVSLHQRAVWDYSDWPETI